MQDINEEVARNPKWTYMGHLAKIEEWLFKASRGLDKSLKMNQLTGEIKESCIYVANNFDQAIGDDINLEKRITVVVSTINILLRIHTIKKSSIEILEGKLQRIIDIFSDSLLVICIKILSKNKNNTKDLSDSLSTKPADDIRHSKYAASIFDSLLTNFAQDDLLKRCLDSLFPNEAPSHEGKIFYKF